jgi:hypothetical protein
MSTTFAFPKLLACATCMNDSGGVSQKAANLGIFMMLGVLLLIFTCLAVTAYNFARRARQSKLATR